MPRARPSRRLGALVAVGLPTALVGAHGLLYGRWIVDDAAITFAYARSIATGEGPVLQPGAEPVEGWSNPAWLALLVLGRWLGLFDHGAWFGVSDLVAYPKALALLCCAGVFAAFYAAARVLTGRPVLVTVLAGSVTALVPSFVIWVVSGLENALLALLAVTLACVLARAVVARRPASARVAVGCGLLAALLALTRPDGLIYVLAYPVVLALAIPGRVPLRPAVRASGAYALAFAVPAGSYLVWRLATFGEYLPNTALAKGQGIPSLAELGRPGELVAYAGWLLVLLAAGVVTAVLLQCRDTGDDTGDAVVALLVPLGLAVTAYAVLEPDWMGEHRFATPVWPLTALVTAVAAAHVVPSLPRRARAVGGLLVAVAVLLSGAGWASAAETFRRTPTVPMCVVAQSIGTSLNHIGEILGIRGGTLVAPDVGGSALTSRYTIVDLVGLADARVAAYWKAGDVAGLRDHVFDVVRPAFIETHGHWSAATDIVSDPRMAQRYVPIRTTDPASGWWVRADLVPDAAALAQARAFAAGPAAAAVEHFGVRAPRSSCGPTLTPDSPPVLPY